LKLADAICRSEKLGLGIIVTEHMDLSYPEPESFIFDKEKYFQKYETRRSASVRLGIELGMRPDCLEANRKVVADSRFDYIIGSIHVVNNIDIYDGIFYRHKTKQEIYTTYFDFMLECVKKYDFIHSLGHIDYIARYARFTDPEIYYSEYTEKIDTILKTLAVRDQALEINTRRLKDKTAAQNMKTILKRFAALGGRLVTVGSDAHQTDSIGYLIKEAIHLAEECSLSPVYFKHGKPYPNSILKGDS
jgi:histidinol-phosphatase (PHP family)